MKSSTRPTFSTAKRLELVMEHSLAVNCGSPDMISQLGERRPGADVTLRINPGFGHGHSQKTNTGGEQSKHGIWHTQIEECLRRADQTGVTVTGLHMHIGSGTDMEHLSEVCDAMERVAKEVGRTLTWISAGGGLPVPYKQGETYVDLVKYFELWDATRERLGEKFGHRLSLEIEPGRYLSAESGFLIAEVRSVKRVGENLFVLVDAGFQRSGATGHVWCLSSDFSRCALRRRVGARTGRRCDRWPALRIGRHLYTARRGLRR